MSEIPEDVMKEARYHCLMAGVTEHSDMRVHCEHIAAAAILAERKRCLALCEEYLANVELTGGTIKRFKLDDVNRIAKRAVRYVRDNINGTFDQNWKPATEDAA